MAKKVMLIEDDMTMLTLLGTLLTYEGYSVAKLDRDDDVDLILASIRKEKPDVILLDVHLRQISGFDLLHALRQDDELKHTYVVMSSGMDVQARCQREGADDFILKPYMPDDLIKKICCVAGD
jgi:DNA-binding response OmpR family regulator